MTRSDLCISGDSHIVEVPEIFDGLEQRFGDAAPSIVFEEGRGHLLKVGERVGFSIGRFGVAGAWVNDPQTQEMIKMGYEGLRPGILDPARRLEDQDIDGVTHEVLVPKECVKQLPLPVSIRRVPTHTPNRFFASKRLWAADELLDRF